MLPNVSPEETVCVLLELEVEVVVDELSEEQLESQENDRFWPGSIMCEDSPLASLRLESVTPSCLAAMSLRVSPLSTVCSAWAGAIPATVTPAKVAKLATPTFSERMRRPRS